MNQSIQSALHWRYATKKFNTEKKISDVNINKLLESARLAPTSLGLQPWRAYVITDKNIREQLKAVAWNQPQVSDASHLLVFTVRKTIDEKYIDAYLEEVMRVRNQKNEDVNDYKKMLMGSVNKTPQQIKEWSGRQAYIALGFLLETAALMEIDACPMEGFDTFKFDTILELNKTDYTSVVMAAVGYRSDDDKYAKIPKVRRCNEELFVKI